MSARPSITPSRPRKAASKYKNRKVTVEGKKFDSAKESRRYRSLSLLQAAGEISDLKTQVAFELVPTLARQDGSKERPVSYVADFVYMHGASRIVEDVKSAPTRKLAGYVIKRKLMLHAHGITILET